MKTGDSELVNETNNLINLLLLISNDGYHQHT